MTNFLKALFSTSSSPMETVKGVVERASTFSETVLDVSYLFITILVDGIPYRVEVSSDDGNFYELTQQGDEVAFMTTPDGEVKSSSFRNFTLEARLHAGKQAKQAKQG